MRINVSTGRRHIAATAAVLATAAGSLAASASGAAAWSPYCGSSKYVDQIEVAHDGQGNFVVKLYPNSEARWASAGALERRDAVVEQWHAVQACVPGLYGDLADSIWQQLNCHQRLAAWIDPRTGTWATGDSYDLESWRPPLSWDVLALEAAKRCGNALGVDPSTTFSSPLRPDLGDTDLEHAYDAIA